MKRMIDNKEFDKLLKDVNDISEKVDNIKDIPTITIDETQFTDTTTLQLTDEQFEILSNNAYVNVVMPTGETIGFNIFTNETIIILSNCVGSDSEITYYTARIVKETKIATLLIGDFSGGGKSYQHNIVLTSTYGNRTHKANLTIITSDYSTAMDYDDLLNYLVSQDRVYEGNSNTKLYTATGTDRNQLTVPEYGIIVGIFKNTSSNTLTYVSMGISASTANYGQYVYYGSTSTYTTIDDEVKEL